jgi:hypothetical protein
MLKAQRANERANHRLTLQLRHHQQQQRRLATAAPISSRTVVATLDPRPSQQLTAILLEDDDAGGSCDDGQSEGSHRGDAGEDQRLSQIRATTAAAIDTGLTQTTSHHMPLMQRTSRCKTAAGRRVGDASPLSPSAALLPTPTPLMAGYDNADDDGDEMFRLDEFLLDDAALPQTAMKTTATKCSYDLL